MKTNDKGSIGVFVVITDGRDYSKTEFWKILLVKNRKGKWSLPGGGVNQAERVDDAAVREVKEETGLELMLLRQIGIFSLRKELGIAILFDGMIVDGELKDYEDEEISERKYFNIRDIEVLADHKEIYPAQFGLVQRAVEYEFSRVGSNRPRNPVYGFLIPPIPVA